MSDRKGGGFRPSPGGRLDRDSGVRRIDQEGDTADGADFGTVRLAFRSFRAERTARNGVRVLGRLCMDGGHRAEAGAEESGDREGSNCPRPCWRGWTADRWTVTQG